jgi:hypothetical protein
VLDDVGRLSWRFFSRLVGDTDEPQAAGFPKAPSTTKARPIKDVSVAAE